MFSRKKAARRLVVAAPGCVALLVAALLVVPQARAIGSTTLSMSAGTSTSVACGGATLSWSSSSTTSGTLQCSASASTQDASISTVGTATTYASGGSGKATTALPAGVVSGDVLVSYVETFPGATVTCASGWKRVVDVVNGASYSGSRLDACVTVATGSEPAPSATISPSTQVSMVTIAFSGVDSTSPVDASAGASGATSPSVTTSLPGDFLVLGEGSGGWKATAGAPSGTTLGATVNDRGNSQTAGASVLSPSSGASVTHTWSLKPSSARSTATAGTIALRPAPLSGTATTTATPNMAAGSTWTITCAGPSVTYSPTSANSGSLNCAAATSPTTIQQVGHATTFASGSSGTPSTALPTGVTAGDVLVSYIETFPAAAISCGKGWTKASDDVNGSGYSGTRLDACVTVAGASEPAPSASVNPATQVSMVTLAFSGVDGSSPVDAASASQGLTSPSVTTSLAGDMLVLGQGDGNWSVQASAPSGTTLDASVNDSGNSEAAGAVVLDGSLGASSRYTWTTSPSATSGVTETIALKPGSATSGSSSTTTSTTSSSTTTTSTTTSTTSPSTTTTSPSGAGTTSATSVPPPSSPPARICGDTSLLNGPSTAPSGAVTVKPSQNLPSVVANSPAGTTFWLAPGTYSLGSSSFSQVIPQSGDTFIGAPGAIIDGAHVNNFAFTQHAKNVTIEHLTIQGFGTSGGNNNEGVVNHDYGTGWTIAYDTIQGNAGAGVMLGSNDVLEYNCLLNNGQYGFSTYTPGGVYNVTVSHNEIAGNDTDNWEVLQPGCGCSGGAKFFNTINAVVTDNYVHDNHNVGLWADTDNAGFNIQGNYFSNNYAEGLMYEISYNAYIEGNTFVRNALGQGPTMQGFPTGAIYISESGSDSRVATAYGSTMEITNNVFNDNWGGVILWENANRFCGNTGPTIYCTMVNPTVANGNTCNSTNISTAPYYSDCRWKTENVSVDHNVFSFNPNDFGGATCTASTECGFNGLFSEWGSWPSWSPYQGQTVENAITFNQNNHFFDNTYTGPWNFMVHEQNTDVSFSTWQAAPYGQDQGSTLN